jgi:hypothetical protein
MLENFKKQANILVGYLATLNRNISHGQGLEAVARMNDFKSWNHAAGQAKVTSKQTDTACRRTSTLPRHLLSPAVTADGHSDDRQFEVSFDASAWFAQATDEEIFALYGIGWSGDYEADTVLDYFRDKDADVTALYEYLEATHRQGSRHPVGFECSINGDEALVWLKVHRPALFLRVFADMSAQPEFLQAGLSEQQTARLRELEGDFIGADFHSRVEQARNAGTDRETLASLARQSPHVTALEVCMPDVFGETESPDDIPEWAWIQENGAFSHRGNNKEPGVWEFLVHTGKAWLDGKRVHGVPVRLQPFFDEANRSGAAWVMFHQG